VAGGQQTKLCQPTIFYRVALQSAHGGNSVMVDVAAKAKRYCLLVRVKEK
tara:strand:+ start:835 stop:984 length:150 start_codon:yes stop_codon:yes gene_type:complete